MALGVNEIVIVVLVAVVTAVAFPWIQRRWLAVFPLVCLSAAIFSPADPISTLLIAVPNMLVVALAVRLARRSSARRPTFSA